MAQYSFGVGSITIIPPSTATDTTPQQVGILRDVSLEVSKTTKELKGASIFPVDIAVAGGKVSGKAKNAQITGGLIAQVMTGSTVATGTTKAITDTKAAAASVAVTPPNSGVYAYDLGVVDKDGVPMKYNSATPAVGEYKNTTSTYTFAAGQSGNVYISYAYTVTSGRTIDYNNQLMGASTVFQLVLFNTFRGKSFGVKLHAVTVPKLAFAFKNEDYMEQDLDFEAFANDTGDVLQFYIDE